MIEAQKDPMEPPKYKINKKVRAAAFNCTAAVAIVRNRGGFVLDLGCSEFAQAFSIPDYRYPEVRLHLRHRSCIPPLGKSQLKSSKNGKFLPVSATGKTRKVSIHG